MPSGPQDDVRNLLQTGTSLLLHIQQRDPILEYEDEFGRIRTARKSDIPRHLLPREHREIEVEEDDVICTIALSHYHDSTLISL